MDVYLMIINQSTIASFAIFSTSMEEEPWNDCFTNEGIVFTARANREAILVQKFYQLFFNIFCSSKTSLLNEVFFGPSRTKALVFPSLKYL